jgi:hypothetical protein
MKLNANRLRTRLAPSAAAAQVIYNEATEFNEKIIVTKSPHQDAAVRAETFLWIVRQGARSFDVVEEEPEIDSTRCAICTEAHNDDAGHRLNGPLYLKWFVCVRCGRWYGVSCLGITDGEFELRKTADFECLRFPSCKNKPAGYHCDLYKKYAAEQALQDAKEARRRR